MPLAAERKLDLTLPQRVSREQLQEVLDRAQAEQCDAAWVCMALDCSLRGLALLVEHHGLKDHPWVQRMLPARRSGRAPAEVTGLVQVQRPVQSQQPAGETREERRARREREAMMEEWPPERRRRQPTEEQKATLRQLWEAGVPPGEAAEQVGVGRRTAAVLYSRFAAEASRTETPEGEKAAASESGAGAQPAEAWGQQAEEQPQTGGDPAVLTTDQAEAEELAAAMQLQALAEAQDDDVADRPADLPLELVDMATTPQHLCARCLKADVCPTPEVLSGYRPEVPELPTRLAGAVDLEVQVAVRSCRHYVPTPAGEEQPGAAQGQGEG